MQFKDAAYKIFQREIVGRIEAERKIVEGNRELIRLYEAKIKQVIAKVWES